MVIGTLTILGLAVLSSYSVYDLVLQGFKTYSGGCERTWELRHDLGNTIFGQQAALDQIIEFVTEWPIHGSHGVYTAMLVGGPGVGKTLASSIVQAHYTPRDKIVHINPKIQPLNEDTFKAATYKLQSVTQGFGLIIIDGIDINSKELLNFVNECKIFAQNNNLNIKIIVIPEVLKMYPTPDNKHGATEFASAEEYLEYLRKVCLDSGRIYSQRHRLDVKYVLFVPLGLQAVEECVLAAVSRRYGRQIEAPQKTVQEIVSQLVQGHSDFVPSGCLDVEAEVNLL